MKTVNYIMLLLIHSIKTHTTKLQVVISLNTPLQTWWTRAKPLSFLFWWLTQPLIWQMPRDYIWVNFTVCFNYPRRLIHSDSVCRQVIGNLTGAHCLPDWMEPGVVRRVSQGDVTCVTFTEIQTVIHTEGLSFYWVYY